MLHCLYRYLSVTSAKLNGGTNNLITRQLRGLLMLQYREIFYGQYASTHSLSKKNVDVHLLSGKEFLTHVIKHHFPLQKESKIIELGCGSGTLLYLAKKMGYQ